MKIVAFTGAGISAESGIPTFRDSSVSIYNDSEIMEIISVDGLKNQPEKLFDFHNKYRKDCRFKKPNLAHKILKVLEDVYNVHIITQNVDDLHEKADSINVYHLHGELFKSRLMDDDTNNPTLMDCRGDLNFGDSLEDGALLRPHSVLFGEMPYNIEKSNELISDCDVLLIIGTSLQIAYTWSLIASANRTGVRVIYINPDKSNVEDLIEMFDKATFEFMEMTASEGLKNLKL